jgi:hypothetical protein
MSRFLEQNQVVLDRQTGLMWTRDASLSDFSLTWNEALQFVKELNRSQFSGYGDWKLPNRRELFSLMSHETINPSLPPAHPFVQVFTGYYWTSTSCARLPSQAWYVHLGGARVFKGRKQDSYMVWPVRIAEQVDTAVFQTGQHRCYDGNGAEIGCRNTGQDGEYQAGRQPDASRFRAEADGIHDLATGLTWVRDANINKDMLDWQSAGEAIELINREGRYIYPDWRLPTIAELESLTDLGRHSPALPAGNPFINVEDFYWSATTSRYDSRYAWALYMKDGAVGVGYKPLPEFYLWPVRRTTV